MLLEGKHTHIAYRCPGCGYTIFGLVTPFTMSQNMLRLKCQCGESELGMQFTKDKKVHLTVPCLFCGQPHHYTVSQGLFLERDLFVLGCPYTNMDIAFVGKKEQVDEALQMSQAELEQLFAQLGQDEDEQEPGTPILPDAQVYDILRFVVKELEADGAIHCPCGDGVYEAELREDGISVYCTECGASRLIATNSLIAAQDFLSCDHLELEFPKK